MFNRPYVLLALAALFWAGNAIVGRAVHAEIPPIKLAFWRWFCAFWIVLPLSWRFIVADWRQIVKHWQVIVLLSALGVAAFGALSYTAIPKTW